MAINHKKVESELPLWMDSSRKEELEKWERALALKMWPDKDEIESSNQRRGKSDRGESWAKRKGTINSINYQQNLKQKN